LNELALFAGGGGGSLGSTLLDWGTVCYVEKDPYCQDILHARIRDGVLSDAPIWDDVKTFDGRPWFGLVDVLSAGFPCQPWSVAGQQRGESDERNLWPDTLRIIREVRPCYAFLENVPGLKAKPYFGIILSDLAESGYGVRWTCLSASACGAPHIRDRLWILGTLTDGKRFSKRTQQDSQPITGERASPSRNNTLRLCDDVADPNINGRDPRRTDNGTKGTQGRKSCGGRQFESVPDTNSQPKIRITEPREKRSAWDVEPDVGRVVNGMAHRVDRLRAIGNGQVPSVAARAWEILTS